ncbi:hypothetical protein [Prevotella pallens]|nr:hypothetical protein [Prevotella pallens]MBF1465275.1 hypothetical protein [Prevotella pallens]
MCAAIVHVQPMLIPRTYDICPRTCNVYPRAPIMTRGCIYTIRCGRAR